MNSEAGDTLQQLCAFKGKRVHAQSVRHNFTYNRCFLVKHHCQNFADEARGRKIERGRRGRERGKGEGRKKGRKGGRKERREEGAC